MDKKVIRGNDMYFAMLQTTNEDINIDPIYVSTIEEMAEKEETMRWWGMVYNFNGLNIKELKHPFFNK